MLRQRGYGKNRAGMENIEVIKPFRQKNAKYHRFVEPFKGESFKRMFKKNDQNLILPNFTSEIFRLKASILTLKRGKGRRILSRSSLPNPVNSNAPYTPVVS